MRYRIRRDRYAGYEVLFWRWWFPFYVNIPINTFITLERAQDFAKRGGILEEGKVD